MSNMQLQLSPLSPRAGAQGRNARVSDLDTSMNIDSPVVVFSKPAFSNNNKSVRFTSDNPMSLENGLVSALETLAANGRKHSDLLTHISKIEEDQLTLAHENLKSQRTDSILSARIYNAQMCSRANEKHNEFESNAPLANVANSKGVLPSHFKLRPIDCTRTLFSLSFGALENCLEFYGLVKPTVYLNPTRDREAGAMRFVLAKHIGCFGLNGIGASLTDFGASE